MNRFIFSLILTVFAAPAWAQTTSADYIKSGNEYYARSDYDRAIADYTKAIQLNPNDPAGSTTAGSPSITKRILTARFRISPRPSA